MLELGRWRVGAALLLFAFASSCSTMQQAEQEVKDNPKAVLGAVVGVAGGALIAVAAGGNAGEVAGAALAGGIAGGAIGHHLDKRDKAMAEQAAQQAFETSHTGQASVWNNPDTGNHGSVTPTKTYQLATGQYCREYTQDIWIGGNEQHAYGTACRQADGSWQIEA